MKEIGSDEATQAYLLCKSPYCGLNDIDLASIPVEQAIAQGKVHDKILYHEAVIAKFDDKHPLTTEQKISILGNTGMHLG